MWDNVSSQPCSFSLIFSEPETYREAHGHNFQSGASELQRDAEQKGMKTEAVDAQTLEAAWLMHALDVLMPWEW